MTHVSDQKAQQMATRKAKLAKALKANVKRRKAPAAAQAQPATKPT